MEANFLSISPIPTLNQGTLTRIIDEQIAWYEENASRQQDDCIIVDLMRIKNLAERIEGSEEIMFLEKIFKTFGEILEAHREVIASLQMEADYVMSLPSSAADISPKGKFTSEAQVEAAFISYMSEERKSSYTANDYCSRIRNVWSSFYKACADDSLPPELTEGMLKEDISPSTPLLNAYNHRDEMSCYISIMISETNGNRNWQNAKAAMNKFSEALVGKSDKKGKAIPSKQGTKDFSKYLFDGKIYKKARLALAVVQKYVKDERPETFKELEDAFPASLQGSLGVVKLEDTVSDKYKGEGGVKRYFLNEDEVIRLNAEETVIVCTQWGVENTERLIAHAKTAFGYEIEKV